ncbi:apolipoprotein N-acyltransferase [Nocardia aurantiaca]|uniref:Apolipoprotein N-acyltransferase n=1 Tax=Nocardia aurantiaca TaxID=2675850 RepID=A0A6I3L2Y9_9NOCA|nr:apolipoprotein N-acyltransferase [Nocardia aurantiaca]
MKPEPDPENTAGPQPSGVADAAGRDRASGTPNPGSAVIVGSDTEDATGPGASAADFGPVEKTGTPDAESSPMAASATGPSGGDTARGPGGTVPEGDVGGGVSTATRAAFRPEDRPQVAARVVAVVATWSRLTRLLAAVVAGLLLYVSFPPRTLWLLAPVGIAVLTLAVRGTRRARGGFGLGFAAGLAFFVPLLPWTGIYVGPMPWLALSTVCALYVGFFGLLTRWVATLPGWPLWVATVWSLTEWARSSFPFGGFPWGKLAFGQADGWYLPYAMIGGAPVVSFAVALTGTGLAWLAVDVPRRFTTTIKDSGEVASATANSPRWKAVRPISWNRIVAAAMLVAIVPLTGVILRSALPGPEDGNRPITVAAIQGSVPRLGLDFNAQRRAVLDNHVKRTEELARDIAAGKAPRPDVVIWPENSSDIDPLRNEDAAQEISQASKDVKAPILVGAVLVNDDRTTTNSVIVWNGDAGPGERHDKKIIQPFGEYLPYRNFFRHFSEYADRAGYFVPGAGDGVVRVRPVSGGDPLAIGVATCYEVVFDRAFEESVRAGAQILAVPTNNATFGRSEMTYQQLAMSRVRAVEHGRAVVVSATTGVSAMITADGVIRQQTPQFEPAALVARLPLRDDTTLATRLGPAPEVLLCILAAAATVAALIRRRSRIM